MPANPTTVYVNKHNCSVGFDALGASIYGLAAGCNEGGTDGVAFTLTDISNASTPATTSGGMASWPNVPTGAITLTETIPSGYDSVRVFCNTKNLSGDESGFSEYPATNGAISATTKSGYDFYCDWFDIPPATVSVTITKYDCPANAGDPTAFGSLLQLCAPQPGVTFDLTAGSAGTATPMTTDAQGGAQWTALAPGDSTCKKNCRRLRNAVGRLQGRRPEQLPARLRHECRQQHHRFHPDRRPIRRVHLVQLPTAADAHAHADGDPGPDREHAGQQLQPRRRPRPSKRV